MLELIERAAWRVPTEWLERLRRTAGTSSPHVRPPKLIDPLTQRERDVLRFLPSRLTIREIADELFVSVNTLKFHLKVIYRKLGVNSRAEAAELARRMSHLT
jgi:LuxR family maltose regulon positive regulatory protein